MELSQIFDAIMMICFGAAWPVAIMKTLRTKRVTGKSLFFLFFVFIGYSAGIVYKFLEAGRPDTTISPVVFLYILNLSMVTVEILLWFRYRHHDGNGSPAVQLDMESPSVEARKLQQ